MELPPCVICGQQASGIHYGVMSCDACKTFFRRNYSLVTQQELICDKGGNCDVMCKPRSCRSCRMKKCLAMGMSDTAVKLGRYSHTQRVEVQIEAKNLREEPTQLPSMQWSKTLCPKDPPADFLTSAACTFPNTIHSCLSKGSEERKDNESCNSETYGTDDCSMDTMHIVENQDLNTCIGSVDCKENEIVVLDPYTGELTYISDGKKPEEMADADTFNLLEICENDLHCNRDCHNNIETWSGKESDGMKESTDTNFKFLNIDDCPNGIQNFTCLDDMKCHYGFLTCSLLNLDLLLDLDVEASVEMENNSMENPDMSSAIGDLVMAVEKFCPFQRSGCDSKINSNGTEIENEEMAECLCEELPPFSNDEYFALFEAIGIDVDGRRKQIRDHMIQYKSLTRHYANFAQKIPGFVRLMKEDKLALLNSARLDFFLLVMHQAFDPDHRVILGFSGEKYPIPEHSNLMPQNLMKVWIEVMTKVRQLDLAPLEMSVVYALVITATDRCKLKELSKVKILNDRLKKYLENLSSTSHNSSPTEHCLQIHLMLSELRQLTNMIRAEHREDR